MSLREEAQYLADEAKRAYWQSEDPALDRLACAVERLAQLIKHHIVEKEPETPVTETRL